jgi:hypothetical protein
MAATTAPAIASPASDVETLVRTTVDHLADGQSSAGFAKGATVLGIHHNVIEFDTGKITAGDRSEELADLKTYGRLWPMIFGNKEKPAGTRKLGKVTVTLASDGKAAWFIAPLALPAKRTMHVSGMAMLQGTAWQLSIFSAELAIADSELAKHPVLAPRIAMTWANPKSKLGTSVVAWMKGKALAKHAASGVVLAGGSAPDELSSGPDAVNFVAKLDKLGLLSMDLEGNDTTGVAIGWAWLPISKEERDGVIQFGFAVYAVQEGGEWKWKSIQFANDQVPSRD